MGHCHATTLAMLAAVPWLQLSCCSPTCTQRWHSSEDLHGLHPPHCLGLSAGYLQSWALTTGQMFKTMPSCCAHCRLWLSMTSRSCPPGISASQCPWCCDPWCTQVRTRPPTCAPGSSASALHVAADYASEATQATHGVSSVQHVAGGSDFGPHNVEAAAQVCYSCERAPYSLLVLQIVGHHNEEAAGRMHAWLERTSFFKVPRSHQDEVADQCGKLFEQVGISSCRSTDAACGQSL